MDQRPLALGQQRVGEDVEGRPTAVAPIASASWTVMVRASASNVMALAPRTWEWTIFPAQRMDVALALFGIEELVEI